MSEQTNKTKYEIVGPKGIDPTDIRCPTCGNTNVLVVGKFIQNFTEEVVGDTIHRTLYNNKEEEIDEIRCRRCNTTTLTTTQYIYDLLHINDDFLSEIGWKKER